MDGHCESERIQGRECEVHEVFTSHAVSSDWARTGCMLALPEDFSLGRFRAEPSILGIISLLQLCFVAPFLLVHLLDSKLSLRLVWAMSPRPDEPVGAVAAAQ